MHISTLTALVNGISSDHVAAFFLVLARITPLFIIAPVFSSPQMVPRVRTVLAVAISIGLTPVAAHGQALPTGVLALAGLIIEGLLVGFVLAFAVACMFAGVQGAGVLADSLSGFSYGSSVDPVNGNPGGALTNLYSMVGMALFIVIGGDAWMLRGFAATFRAVPLASSPHVTSIVSGAESMFGTVILSAVEVAAPLMLSLVITDVAFGMVSKVVPQLNVFAVGFPVKIGVALIVVGVSLPFVAGWINNGLQSSVTSAVNALV